MTEHTLRERLLDTFAHKSVDRIVFNPRLYYWYLGNNLFSKTGKDLKGRVPEKYRGKSQLEIHDMLDAGIRYCEESLYLPLIGTKIDPEAEITIKSRKGTKIGETITTYTTPLGVLTETGAVGGGLGAHYTEYPVKNVEDIAIMKYILENTSCQFFEENFKKAENTLAHRGVASTYLYSSPYQRLVKFTIGFTRTTVLLRRQPKEIEEFLLFLEQWDDKMYEFFEKSPLKIVNFGENIDANLSPPLVFEKYLIPSPNLILGVSDELSPNGDITKLEKIRDIVNTFEP